MHVTQEGPDFLSRYCPVQAFGLGETVNASSNQELPIWKSVKKLPVIASSAVSTRIRICMSPPLSMIRTAFSGANASRQRDKGTGKCLPGCDPSERSSASASRRPAPNGAGLLRYMQQAGIEVLEVTTPDKHDRRKRGKNDDLDAQNAAHAAFAGRRTVTPKSRDGMIESLRVLKACRKTAVAARRIALQMIHNTIVCAPDELRETLRKMTRMQLVRTPAAWRPDLADYRNVVSAYRITLKSLGRRYLELHDEIADLDSMIGAIVDELAPSLVARNSIGHGAAAQLLLTAGDNVQRLQSEASFAALCGVSPVPASSGKTTRHRLNRGGDRAANSSLHIIAIGRLRTDPRTKAYMAKRIAEGHSKLEIIRCLKRYIAREVFTLIKSRQREINQARAVA